jgi:hypothetical protein
MQVSKGRALVFLVSKQNLNPSYWHICSGALKIIKNRIGLRKLLALKKEGVRISKKQTTKCYKGRFLNTQKFLVCCYVTSRVPK